MKPIKISIVDDHSMVSKAIEGMFVGKDKYTVVSNNCNGEDFISTLEKLTETPDVVLMDINMPFKNGIETTQWLTENHPETKVIALTMEDAEDVIIKTLKAGAKGYLFKDMNPDILFQAIDEVMDKGCFYTDSITQTLLKVRVETNKKEEILADLKERELEFIKWACSELTYREIADKMFVSPKTVDGYRESVFLKLGIKSRVGLVLYAIENDLKG